MGRAMVTRLALGLLLLALLLPAQVYSQSTNSTTPPTGATNSTTSASTTPTTTASTSTNATSGSDGVLQSVSCLFMILFSLLHLYC